MTKQRLISVALFILSLVLSFICDGCGRPQGELFPAPGAQRVWPEPPEIPRIRHLGTISTERDLKRGSSFTQTLGKLVFGKKEMGVLLNPYAVVVDEADRLFATDTAGAVVHIFDLDTREYRQFSALAENEALTMPVAMTTVERNIYVVDSVLRKICVFDRDGKFEFSFGSERLKRPSGIAYYAKEEKVFVSDTSAHIISVFDKTGQYKYSIGSRGAGPGLFNFPTHLCVDDSGQLFVSDTLNYRVQVFSSDGKFLRMFGRHGDRPGCFAHPCGIATDRFGHVYVADRQFENVQVFDNNGRILMAFGSEGSELGEFWLPAGLYIDKRNRIFVADSFNKRIQTFELLNVQNNDDQK